MIFALSFRVTKRIKLDEGQVSIIMKKVIIFGN